MNRVVVLGALVAVYVTVSVVAYTDFPRRAANAPLTDLELEGLAAWRSYNCQACHQIYGFGGFFGPDLTNRVTDATPDEELSWIMKDGSGRMPAFDLSSAERTAILAFLRAVNRTGQSQPDPLAAQRSINPVEHYRRLTEAWIDQTGGDLTVDARRGLDVWDKNGCGVCHTPLALGRDGAPDLSQRTIDRSPEAMGVALDRGRGRMPPFHLAPTEIADLSAYLEWVAQHRADLTDVNDRLLEREVFSWRAVPWFEYR